MVVWYSDKKALFSGDNFYRSFPNLYAIRGTEYRDFDTWALTLDKLMAFKPEILAPGHTKALHGEALIREVLTDYRDAIRHVVDETRNGMDAGMTMDQLADSVKLPPKLAEKPYLREYYGCVAYAVRAYFVGTTGWFDGNPTSLRALSPVEEAERFIRLAGGADAVMSEIEKARGEDDYQWALQLVDRLMSVSEGDRKLNGLKAAILREHAVSQINCPTRHYYIQSAFELEQNA